MRDRLSAIAALGAERRPMGERPWTTGANAEAQLGAALDALVAEIPADALLARADEVPTGAIDPGMAFARAIVLGSVEATAEAAVRTLRTCTTAPARAVCAEGLWLARSAAVGAAVQRLLGDAPAATLAAALDVLRVRRQASFGHVVTLLAHPEPQVAIAAARALATLHERKAAAAVLRHRLAGNPPAAVGLGLSEALLSLGDPTGLSFVRAKLTAESAMPALSDDLRVGFLRLLGLAGEASDLDLFYQSLEPSPRDATAVGWFGHPDLVEWLLGSLETANETRRAKGGMPTAFETAAARALFRVLGSPSQDPGAEALPRAVGIGVDASPWRAYWQKVRARQMGKVKLRYGRPYSPILTIEELGGETGPSARAEAALELAIVSGGNAALEPGDWAMRQRAVLAVAKAAHAGDAAGEFVGGRLSAR